MHMSITDTLEEEYEEYLKNLYWDIVEYFEHSVHPDEEVTLEMVSETEIDILNNVLWKYDPDAEGVPYYMMYDEIRLYKDENECVRWLNDQNN